MKNSLSCNNTGLPAMRYALADRKGCRTTFDIKEEIAGCDMAIESKHYIYTFLTMFSDNPMGKAATAYIINKQESCKHSTLNH